MHSGDVDQPALPGALTTGAASPSAARGGLSTILNAVLVTLGIAGIAGWLVLALVHLGDRYRIGHVQGHWMALAQYASHGTLYPPLSDGVRFGGTRHMALPIMANAMASRLTGEYLMSGRVVAIALFATVLVFVLITLRQMRCPWPLAIALTGLLPATNTGVLVGSTPGGDVLPVVLQIGSLLTVMTALRRDRLELMIAAGVVAGLAGFSKLTGVWAILAVVSWLGVRRDWHRLGWFVASCGVTAALTLGIVQWASHGRFLITFRTLTFAGTGGPADWVRAPNQLMFFGIGDATAVWTVAPFAILGAIAAWRDSALTVYHHALGWSLLITLVVFSDVGAGFNQLLDPAVLTVVAVGYLISRLEPDRIGSLTLATALALAVIWAAATGIRAFVPDLREAVTSVRAGRTLPKYNPRPLADVVTGGDRFLAEDPGIPVLFGQTPIVLDAFMLRRLDQVRPDIVNGLIVRIEQRQFDDVALINPLDADDFWWRNYHLGPRIVTALRSTYVLRGQVDGYYLYEPRRR